jgi:hypothetical protein
MVVLKKEYQLVADIRGIYKLEIKLIIQSSIKIGAFPDWCFLDNHNLGKNADIIL